MMKNKVVWIEGMFLQPQHFQQQDDYIEQFINNKTLRIVTHHWGIERISVDDDALKDGRIQLNHVSGVFADGTPFCAPEHDQLPGPITVSPGTRDTLIYLGMLARQTNKTSVRMNPEGDLTRYQAQQGRYLDTVQSSQTPCVMHIARISLCLLSEQHNLDDYTTIAVLHIEDVRSNKSIQVNHSYIYPVIHVMDQAQLRKFTLETHGLLQQRAAMLSHRINHVSQSPSSEADDFMLLQLINRHESLFQYFCHKADLTPEALYTELIQLLGELSSFTQQDRRAIAIPPYQHHRLDAVYSALMVNIRTALNVVLTQSAIALPLVEHEHGLWVCDISSEAELISATDYILAVSADTDPNELSEHFARHTKLASREQIHHLVSRALPGIDLNLLPLAPRQIPSHANFRYYSINTHQENWHDILNSGSLALHVGANYAGLTLELWAIKG